MKKQWKNWLAALMLALPLSANASGGGHYEHVDIDLGDQLLPFLPFGQRHALQPLAGLGLE